MRALAAGVAVAVAVSVFIAPARAANDHKGVVVVEARRGFKVNIVDPKVSLQSVNDALAETGLDVRALLRPVSPSLVGQWIGGKTPFWNVMLKIDLKDRSRALLRRTGRPTVVLVGRKARKGETYFAARDPFCRSEPLAGLGIENLDPASAGRALEALGVRVSWRSERTLAVDPGHRAATGDVVTEPPSGVITQAIATRSKHVILFVVPTDDSAALHRSIGKDC